MFANNFCYGQSTSGNDSIVCVTMGEMRKIAYIINENSFLREEKKLSDSLISHALLAIELSKINFDISIKQNVELRKMFNDCMKINTIHQEQIKIMQAQHKKEKRKILYTAGGGGFLLGVILTIILL